MNENQHVEPCDCHVCKFNNVYHKQAFNDMVKEHGLSEDEARMMRNEIEDMTGFNLC